MNTLKIYPALNRNEIWNDVDHSWTSKLIQKTEFKKNSKKEYYTKISKTQSNPNTSPICQKD